MHYETSKILVKNAFNQLFHVPHWHKLDHLLDMTYKNCFLIDTQSAYNAASVPASLHSFSNLSAEPTLLPINALIEIVLNNGIRMFKDASLVKQISDLVTKYLLIWEFQGFVQILPKWYMKVLLKHCWKAKVLAIKLRVYPLGNDT